MLRDDFANVVLVQTDFLFVCSFLILSTTYDRHIIVNLVMIGLMF